MVRRKTIYQAKSWASSSIEWSNWLWQKSIASLEFALLCLLISTQTAAKRRRQSKHVNWLDSKMSKYSRGRRPRLEHTESVCQVKLRLSILWSLTSEATLSRLLFSDQTAVSLKSPKQITVPNLEGKNLKRGLLNYLRGKLRQADKT